MHDPDGIEFSLLEPWIRTVRDPCGEEHLVLTDGWRHIRIDVEQGRLRHAGPVRLRYGMARLPRANEGVMPLRRLLDLWDKRQFCATLYPPDPRAQRFIDTLRASDAIEAGATQREIATELYGEDAVSQKWDGGSDATRSRVRRIIREAQALLKGGFRKLMR